MLVTYPPLVPRVGTQTLKELILFLLPIAMFPMFTFDGYGFGIKFHPWFTLAEVRKRGITTSPRFTGPLQSNVHACGVGLVPFNKFNCVLGPLYKMRAAFFVSMVWLVLVNACHPELLAPVNALSLNVKADGLLLVVASNPEPDPVM